MEAFTHPTHTHTHVCMPTHTHRHSLRNKCNEDLKKIKKIHSAEPQEGAATKTKEGVIYTRREEAGSEKADFNISDMRSTDFFCLCPNKLVFKMEFPLIQAPLTSSWTQTPSLNTPIPHGTPTGI